VRIGILTGGGDAPGLNAAIRAVARRAFQLGHQVSGVQNGWAGCIEEGLIDELTPASVRGILPLGGTILGTSRTNPFATDDGVERVQATLDREGVDALIAIGGDDTLGAAGRLGAYGVNAVGVPKTIDNDLSATDFTFGFHTAVQVATDAIDRLQTTAESHNRVIVVEVMGRHAGWIAVYAGIAGGADIVLVPEQPFDIDAVCARIEQRHRSGTNFSIVVVAEGAHPLDGTISVQSGELDAFGHERLGGISNVVADEIGRRTGFETRVTILGHVLRGGTPTAYDRVLATRFGIAAIDAVHAGEFGVMVALRGTDVVRVPIAEATARPKTVDAELLEVASVFFG
jgi:phosphofructokinase-like protein